MKTLINDYLALWNERDAGRRAAAAAALLTEDTVYSDPDYAALTGRTALIEAIGHAQKKFGTLVFTLGEIIAVHHNQALFTWRLVSPDDGEPVATGHDFAEVRDGRIVRIVGFF